MSEQAATTNERLASIESEVGSLAGNVNRFIHATEQRIEKIEGTVNQPFPMIPFASVMIASFAILGAMLSFALGPLFTETERNRLGILNNQGEHKQYSEFFGQFQSSKELQQDTREWMRTVSDRERQNAIAITALDSAFDEFQSEALRDKETEFRRLEIEISRNSSIEQMVARNEAAIKFLSQEVKAIDEGGSRLWNTKNKEQ